MKTVLVLLVQDFKAYEAGVITDIPGWRRDSGDFPVNPLDGEP